MPTDLILLGILHTGDYYGYEIMKIIKSVMIEITDVTTGTLYYKLNRLEKKGLVTHLEEKDGKRPVRFRYSITDEGRTVFQRMAQDHIVKASRPYWPVMPSLFFINLLDPETSILAIQERIKFLKMELDRLGKLSDYFKQVDYPFQAELIVQHGIEHMRTDIDILNRFIEKLTVQGLKQPDEIKSKLHFERFMDDLPGREQK